MKINDRRVGNVRRELPFNSFWLGHLQDDARIYRGDANGRATVRASVDVVRMPSPRAQP